MVWNSRCYRFPNQAARPEILVDQAGDSFFSPAVLFLGGWETCEAPVGGWEYEVLDVRVNSRLRISWLMKGGGGAWIPPVIRVFFSILHLAWLGKWVFPLLPTKVNMKIHIVA